MSSSPRLEELQIIQLLKADVRLSFAKMGTILGVSEQTAARRYQALVREGVIRCTALLDSTPFGQAKWILRIVPAAGGGNSLAESLARHPAMSWVGVTTSEIICEYQPWSDADRDTMLTDRLPKTSVVQSVTGLQTLRRFPLATPWPDLKWTLNDTQREALERHADSAFASRTEGDTPTSNTGDTLAVADEKLARVLTRDPRASYSQLAKHTGMPAPRVAARIRELAESGVLQFDLDLAHGAIGFPVAAGIFANVPLDRLEAAGHALGQLSEVQFVCATTGPTNLFAAIGCRDVEHLYHLLTRQISTVEGVGRVEVSTDLRQFKNFHALVKHDRLRGATPS